MNALTRVGVPAVLSFGSRRHEQICLNQLADQMLNGEMGFLNVLRIVAGNSDQDIRGVHFGR
jgi:hypothetical protein